MIVPPHWERNRPLQNRWDVVVVTLDRIMHGRRIGASEQDHFDQVLLDAKRLCIDPENAKGFTSDSIRLAGRMLDYDELKQIIMEIETIDDIDKDIAKRMLRFLDYIRAFPRRIWH